MQTSSGNLQGNASVAMISNPFCRFSLVGTNVPAHLIWCTSLLLCVASSVAIPQTLLSLTFPPFPLRRFHFSRVSLLFTSSSAYSLQFLSAAADFLSFLLAGLFLSLSSFFLCGCRFLWSSLSIFLWALSPSSSSRHLLGPSPAPWCCWRSFVHSGNLSTSDPRL